jgi:hypothetical protein
MSVEENGTGRLPSREDSTAQHSFDDLARGLASGALSRRRALRLLGGALVGSMMASFPGVAKARGTEGNGDNDKRCLDRRKTRCNGKCVNLQKSEKHCGRCGKRCRSDQTCCKGHCVNLQKSEKHCGSCGKHCRSTQTCCKGHCVNLQGNERHCGSCFNRCQENETCVNGTCRRAEGQCQTASDCPQPTDECQKAVCTSGQCTNVPHEGKACNDNNPCTENDTCTATGACVGTLKNNCVQCQDDTQCTDVPVDECFAAVCGAGGFCVVEVTEGVSCDDGNPCTESGTCTAAGTCDPGPVKTCPPSENPCAEPVCNPVSGDCELVPANEGALCRQARGACEEDAVCTGTSTECPETFFGAGTVCREAAGDCDVEETCTGTSADCPPDAFEANGTSCNDGNPCTTGDRCLNGVCTPTANAPRNEVCAGSGNDRRRCCNGICCPNPGNCTGANPGTCPAG